MNLFRILFLIIISFYSSLSFATVKLNHGWEYQWEGDGDSWQEYPDVKTPLVNQNKFLWLRVKLPSLHEYKIPTLNLRLKTEFEAYSNGKLFYAFHKNWNVENEKRVVSHIIAVPLKDDSTNYVYFKVASGSKQIGLDGEVDFDEHSNLLKTIISNDVNRLLLGAIFCFFSIIILVVAIVTKDFPLLYIFGFTANLSIWTISFCHETTQNILLGGATKFWESAMYWSCFLTMIFLLSYIVNLKNIFFKNTIQFFRKSFIIFTVVVFLSAIFSITTLRSATLIFNIMLIPTAFTIIVTAFLSFLQSGRESRMVFIGIFIMGFYILIDSLSYVSGFRIVKMESPCSQWGAMIVCVTVIIAWIQRYKILQKKLSEVQKKVVSSFA